MRIPNEELPITTVKIVEVYRRFRASKVLRGTSEILDDEIFGLICEEEAIDPYDVEWWNSHYASINAAANEIKEVWEMMHPTQQSLIESDEGNLGNDYYAKDNDIPM